ncbi:MAG: glycoside hydrolase family 130 protein [Fibrobacteria bacterium]|nr:glycoside hydrolase family 130 protein [Fibrobacteria bacterium]
MLLHRTKIKISPDRSRVIIRPFFPYHKKENTKVIARVMSLTEKEVTQELHNVLRHFSDRHFDTEAIILSHYREIEQYMLTDIKPSKERQLLIGAYFTSEFSLESAALFNPSIVPHPDQDHVPSGSLRFIMSLRAIGEGHISSVTFRDGIIHKDNSITMEKACQFVTTPEPLIDTEHSKKRLKDKLLEMEIENKFTEKVSSYLPKMYTASDLKKAVRKVYEEDPRLTRKNNQARDTMKMLVQSDYQIEFYDDLPLSARVIFPNSPSERKGIEDARFVLFTSEAGEKTYYAMYTAWSGQQTLPQLLETKDFLHFKMFTLHGDSINDKGMALFPEKIDGKYASLARQDGENMYLIYSDDIRFWREHIPLLKPSYPWEMVKVGNCGSPILIDDGWLVITHGVGPMRRYCLGAVLLDKKDPTKVIGRLKHPLLEPNENEREGYVPNVVYSCGCMAFNGKIILPYAMSDYASRIAIVDINKMLSKMQ